MMVKTEQKQWQTTVLIPCLALPKLLKKEKNREIDEIIDAKIDFKKNHIKLTVLYKGRDLKKKKVKP